MKGDSSASRTTVMTWTRSRAVASISPTPPDGGRLRATGLTAALGRGLDGAPSTHGQILNGRPACFVHAPLDDGDD
jgi:hypothetical protein